MKKTYWMAGVAALVACTTIGFFACDSTNPNSGGNPLFGAMIVNILSPDRDVSILPGGFLNLSSQVVGGTAPYSYDWSINVGSPPYTSTEQNPSASVTFPLQGAYNIDLTVTDADNKTASTRRRVNATSWRPLDLTLSNFSAYNGKDIHVNIIDSGGALASHTRVTRGTYPTGDRWVIVPSCIPPGAGHSLWVWSDDDASARWDATDPSWSFAIPDAAGLVQATVLGSGLAPATPPAFTEDQPFTIFMSDLQPYLGRDIIGRFIENDTGHTVGQVYVDNISDQEAANVTGVVKQGTDYRLQFFFDVDDDAAWETPEIGYRWQGTAGSIFLEAFSPSAPGNFEQGSWFEWEVPFTF